ncbi:MAG TPA: alpha/beta fold hydrolase, partial [Burkholderiaceae bacterium]|nr:alpha/beta fold hydrolase [Burkholderiaceae bacterium]
MLARLLRIVTLAWSLALATALAYGYTRGWTATVVGGAVVLMCAHPALLLAEFLLMAWISRRHGGPRAPLARLLRAWAVEWTVSTRTFGWQMPWREHAQPDHLPPSAHGRRGVVLLHGYVCNRAVWNRWMTRLRAAGHPFIAPTLEPVFGGIESNLAPLEAAVQRLYALTGRPPLIVAHSMGGLVTRAWLRAHADRPPVIDT